MWIGRNFSDPQRMNNPIIIIYNQLNIKLLQSESLKGKMLF